MKCQTYYVKIICNKTKKLNNYNKIPELKKVSNEYRDLKRKLNKKRNKINSFYSKYSFIEEIVKPTIDDFVLEESVRRLFEDIGYFTKRPHTKRNFDVIAYINNRTIGIEVKNSKNVGENEMFQGLKYAGRQINIGKIMHPLMIWNNSKTNQEFDTYRIQDAENHCYSILTTKELLKGYFKFKEQKITFELFNKLLHQKGVIRFSNSILRKMESSEAER